MDPLAEISEIEGQIADLGQRITARQQEWLGGAAGSSAAYARAIGLLMNRVQSLEQKVWSILWDHMDRA